MSWRGHSSTVFRQTCASLLLGIAICAGLFIRCSHEHSVALIPYQSATDISFREFGSADHVTYHVNTKFPAAEVIERISDKLTEEGSQSSQRDEFNPGGYSGDIAMWRHASWDRDRKSDAPRFGFATGETRMLISCGMSSCTTVRCLTLDRNRFLFVNAILRYWST
jgi:hypothetical protein